MKISKKILTASAIAFIAAGSTMAQEFGDDDFGDFSEESGPSLTWNGEAEVSGRGWVKTAENENDNFDLSDTPTDADATLKIEMKYTGSSTDVSGKLKFDIASIKDHPEDIVEELTARGYFGNWQIEAGKMKSVWGKGDKLHVLDNFNANDYTDFVFPDYIDRRLAEPMLKVAYASTYVGENLSNLKFEGIWTPMMTADRFAESGQLEPAAQKNLTSTVEGIIAHNLTLDVASGLTAPTNPAGMVDSIMNASSFSADSLYEDNIKSLKYGQLGARFTGTFGGLDFGASYYYGHYKQPSANVEKFATQVATTCKTWATANQSDITAALIALATNPASLTQAQKKLIEKYNLLSTDPAKFALMNSTEEFALPSLNYDQLQVFGLEAAFVLWRFNTRWEFAYNLTGDTAGDNPWVKNNSIAWLAGFDMDLPIHNLNINIQEQGSLVLKKDKIEDGMFAPYDVDYNSEGKYTSNKIVLNISDKWLYEKLVTECTVIYGIEGKEWCIQPKISYNVTEGLTFTASGAYIYSDYEDGEFYNFTADNPTEHDKAFVQLSAKYQF